MENYKQAMENYDDDQNAERHGEHENEKHHIPGPLGNQEKNQQTKVNREMGTTEEYIHDSEDYGNVPSKRDKGGSVSDKDPRGVWQPDDGIPENESENGLRSMQNNPDTEEDKEEDHLE